MATRHLSFSTEFPAYHPKKGEPTFFIEKIWSGLLAIHPEWYAQFLPGFSYKEKTTAFQTFRRFEPKFHTIREGHRFKVGDEIIPFTWSGKPYRSKWVKPFGDGDLAIPIERVWDIDKVGDMFIFNGHVINQSLTIVDMSVNDGLATKDFIDWFGPAGKNKRWQGQIICWNANIRYLDSDPLPKQIPPLNPKRTITRLP